MTFDAVDDFAGAGGWDQGAVMVGLTTVGIEWDHAACQTAVAAGHARIRADVSVYPSAPLLGIPGYIASPPCQAWSMAGSRKGERDRANCHVLAARMADGDDSTNWTVWEDPRSPLVCQPVRRVRELRPEWVALEEVPAVASLWEHFARIFRGWGYSVWTGDLCAADYGVPQTRTRRILMASRTMTVQPPEPTHAEHPQDADLLGGQLAGWVSMAAALGWNDDDHLVHPRGKGMIARHGPRDDRMGSEPAMTLTSKGRSWLRMGNANGATVRRVEEPAPTVLFGHRSNAVEWHHKQPLSRDEREAVGSAAGEGGVRVTVAEGGVLQSFPADYPWQGSRSKRYEQVGNAIPPRLAAHILAALTGRQLASPYDCLQGVEATA